ncbi:Hypothetical predicted protein [Paramuricea clavata]|uniref:Uncharacterized protein n=1 Tax=Paramuricea clavata TaxID=317549 RepID=A0A6S7H1N4_PARCT|nr:Hypothetical predicted protein [Paramuricea clavata]
MESGQLIFDQVLFDEQMKKSGLLNCISDPIFPLRTQFCFIHLTIQEFLAARHVTETLAPTEIKKIISDHVKKSFEVTDDCEIIVKCHEVSIMKCLKEADDEEITKEV